MFEVFVTKLDFCKWQCALNKQNQVNSGMDLIYLKQYVSHLTQTEDCEK